MKTHPFTQLLTFSLMLIAACSAGAPSGSGQQEPEEEIQYTGQVETYRYYEGLRPSTRFTVSVNDEDQYVYPTSEQHLCAFACDGTVKVVIDSPEADITSVVVRPKAKNPQYRLKDGKIILTMAPKDRYVVDINGEWRNALLLFANAVDTDKPSPEDPNVLYFEAGKVHDAGIINPDSGKTVYFEGGALVNGRVFCDDKDHLTFAGGGMLNCTPEEEPAFRLNRCSYVTMKDFIVLNTSSYGIILRETDVVEADNVKSYGEASKLTETGVENDAFDLFGCRHVQIQHAFSYCHDDTYCIKTRKWAVNRSSEYIRYEDCIGWNIQGGNSFEIGWETGCDVSHVSYKDIYSVHTSEGTGTAYLNGGATIHQVDGGVISDISYENVYLEEMLRYGLYFVVRENKAPTVSIGTDAVWAPGVIRGVKMKNVHLGNMPPWGNCAKGLDNEHSVQVEIDGLYIAGKRVTSLSEANFTVGPYATVTLK